MVLLEWYPQEMLLNFVKFRRVFNVRRANLYGASSWKALNVVKLILYRKQNYEHYETLEKTPWSLDGNIWCWPIIKHQQLASKLSNLIWFESILIKHVSHLKSKVRYYKLCLITVKQQEIFKEEILPQRPVFRQAKMRATKWCVEIITNTRQINVLMRKEDIIRFNLWVRGCDCTITPKRLSSI